MALIETVDNVKSYLRITHSKLDEEIDAQIEACLADMALCGIEADEYNPVHLAAIKNFVKAGFIDDINASSVYLDRYEQQKKSLMFGRYGGLVE